MLRIVHLNLSRSERIIWLCEELGLRYEIIPFRRQPDIFGPPELKEMHGLGRAPVLLDGEVVLPESGAIVEYILARYGGDRLAVGAADPQFPSYLYWLHYAEGSLMLQLLREWSLDRMLPEADAHPGMARFRETTRLHLQMIDDALRATPYFAGQAFTAADIMMAYPFTTLRTFRPLDLAPYPAIGAWIGRIAKRPAYKTAMARAA